MHTDSVCGVGSVCEVCVVCGVWSVCALSTNSSAQHGADTQCVGFHAVRVDVAAGAAACARAAAAARCRVTATSSVSWAAPLGIASRTAVNAAS